MSFVDKLKSINLMGMDVIPIIEGGKGIAVSDGLTAGSFAKMNAVGTFSAVNARIIGEEDLGSINSYKEKSRELRQKEMIRRAIKGGIMQAKVAYETACNKGRIHMNILWEMGGAEEILHGILSKVSNLIHGVTCGAGMPFRIAEICSKYKINYYPIISSARAFKILWMRAYNKFSNFLGGVVYEDPWLAGGHNGISSNEDPKFPKSPRERIKELRDLMRQFGILDTTPIFIAGGVWWLTEWTEVLDFKTYGSVAFQFGTRPLLTVESPIPKEWKDKLFDLDEGDVSLNKFSPTGFYSSAIRNSFLVKLEERSERQIKFMENFSEDFPEEFSINKNEKIYYLPRGSLQKISEWENNGNNIPLKTSDGTFVFISINDRAEIIEDRKNCIGCLSVCKFSGWSQAIVSHKPDLDPRSFCIQKSLQNVTLTGDIENNLVFSGHIAYKFKTDKFYSNKFIPTISQLVERILTGY